MNQDTFPSSHTGTTEQSRGALLSPLMLTKSWCFPSSLRNFYPCSSQHSKSYCILTWSQTSSNSRLKRTVRRVTMNALLLCSAHLRDVTGYLFPASGHVGCRNRTAVLRLQSLYDAGTSEPEELESLMPRCPHRECPMTSVLQLSFCPGVQGYPGNSRWAAFGSAKKMSLPLHTSENLVKRPGFLPVPCNYVLLNTDSHCPLGLKPCICAVCLLTLLTFSYSTPVELCSGSQPS